MLQSLLDTYSRMSNVRTGRVKFFNTKNGYGFIIPDQPILGDAEGKEKKLKTSIHHITYLLNVLVVFVHYTTIHNKRGFKSLAEGESVEFTYIHGPKGLQATKVTGPNGAYVLGDQQPRPVVRIPPVYQPTPAHFGLFANQPNLPPQLTYSFTVAPPPLPPSEIRNPPPGFGHPPSSLL